MKVHGLHMQKGQNKILTHIRMFSPQCKNMRNNHNHSARKSKGISKIFDPIWQSPNLRAQRLAQLLSTVKTFQKKSTGLENTIRLKINHRSTHKSLKSQDLTKNTTKNFLHIYRFKINHYFKPDYCTTWITKDSTTIFGEKLIRNQR